jgi:hypothetical protein
MREAMPGRGLSLLADEAVQQHGTPSAAALVGTLIRASAIEAAPSTLHRLLEHPAPGPADALRIKHMSMRLDPAYGWVYERRLVDGPVQMRTYGAVASSPGLCRFIRRATEA